MCFTVYTEFEGLKAITFSEEMDFTFESRFYHSWDLLKLFQVGIKKNAKTVVFGFWAINFSQSINFWE